MFYRRLLKGSLLLGLAVSLMGCGSPSLVSISITPSTEFFGGPGVSAQFTAIGTYNHGSHPATTADITNQVTWKSNAPIVATITNTGLATSGFGTGSTAITATMNGFTGVITGNATVVVCHTLTSGGNGCAS